MKVDVGGATLRGAAARWFGRPADSNPYPEIGGTLVLRRAWQWGWDNKDAVLEAERTGDWSAVDGEQSNG